MAELSSFTLKAPKWHIPTVGVLEPTSALHFPAIANALIPYVAPAEQKNIATFLASDAPTSGSSYGTYLGLDTTPAEETPKAGTETRNLFFSAQRAKDTIQSLENIRNVSNLSSAQMGPGYRFLTQAISLLDQFGGTPENGMTRAQYEQLQTGLNALTSQADSDKSLAPYADLAKKFINPTTIGNLMPSSILNGRRIFGQASEKLFV